MSPPCVEVEREPGRNRRKGKQSEEKGSTRKKGKMMNLKNNKDSETKKTTDDGSKGENVSPIEVQCEYFRIWVAFAEEKVGR